MPDPIGLEALEQQIRHDLEIMAYPAQEWVLPCEGAPEPDILNCAIVGGGQYGMASAFSLARECVPDVRVFDGNPSGREGPWVTFARMDMLRTEKHMTNLDIGFPNLTFRAWYEAQFGRDAWDRMYRIPRVMWMDYLVWYRRILGLPVQNDSKVVDIAPVRDDLLRLTVERSGMEEHVLARTVIVSTGTEGLGPRAVPEQVATLPKELWAHSNEMIDMSGFAGRRIGILGSGASAYDAAISAVDAGAASAQICFRRADMPTQNPRRRMENSGYLAHFPELPDGHRWSYLQHLYSIGQGPPEPTFTKAMSYEKISLHPASPWKRIVLMPDASIRVDTGSTTFEFDYLILATGNRADLASRPELSSIVGDIATWGERYTPPPERADARLDGYPYLGRFGEFTEKEPGTAPWLKRVFNISRGADLSLGPLSSSSSNMKYALPRIVKGVTRQLFLDGADAMLDEIVTQTHDELTEDVIKSDAA
ncbi:MAG: NAD(P)/FAD-dependent oxidoreductase [Alphaproteobacteria bacterium]|nr:NAD(P)/FAD-dependent oxidoreductase [Alphaproteobacteria bacterium]